MAALLRARADDTFWAARRVVAFSDDLIRAVVRTGQYSNPDDERYLADVLIKRRDKIGRAYFAKINPLINFRLEDGALSFENPAGAAGLADTTGSGYELSWAWFDNNTGATRPIGSPRTSAALRTAAPPELASGISEFVQVKIRTLSPTYPAWGLPVDVYFRRSGTGWRLVGVDRIAVGPKP